MVDELVNTFLHFWAPTNTRRRRTSQSSIPAMVQTLEPRRLLVGNLDITDTALLNGQGQEISAPVVGQMIYVQASWTMDNLTTSDKYVVRFEVDGVVLDSQIFTAVAGSNVAAGTTMFGWYAFPGLHSVKVTLDATSTIAETNEGDNEASFFFAPAAPTTLPDQFGSPIGGRPFQDWSIVNYNDVDPRTGTMADFKGGDYTADAHDGWDIRLANFASMDRGIPIYAAADGVVSAVTDGNFDRETTANTNPPNSVTINHGPNGWQTVYSHLAANTITVKPGQTVIKGQIIGFVGSSGNSIAPQLHFAVLHQGALVETSYDPSTYWDAPFAYQGDLPTTVMESGFTDANPLTDVDPLVPPPPDLAERPADKTTFSRSSDAGKEMWFWFNVTTIPQGADINVRFIRPNGTIAQSFTQVATSTVRGGAFAFSVADSVWRPPAAGTWTVELRVSNQLVHTKTVTVTDAAAPREMRVRTEGGIVVNGRTTPLIIDTTRAFTIENYGGQSLTITSITVPDGFTVSDAPSFIAANGTATFNVSWSGAGPNTFIGDVVIRSNDATDPIYSFRIKKVTTGTSLPGTPVVSLPSGAAVAFAGQAPVIVDPLATVTDDAPTLQDSLMTVELVSGFLTGDALSLILPGYVISGSDISRGGQTVATITLQTATRIDFAFDPAAEFADRQAILRGIAFAASAGPARSGQRIIRVAASDNTGFISQYAYHTVDVPNVRPPTDLVLSNASVPENQASGTDVGFFTTTDPDAGDTHTYQLVSGTGSTDNSRFTLDAAGNLKTAAIFNFEVKNSYSIRVRTTDQTGQSYDEVFTISVTNVNEAPTNIALSNSTIVEGRPVGTIVGTFSTTDPDANNLFSYALVAGAGSTDNASFTLDSAGTLRSAAVFNLAVKSSYSIRVRSTDQGGLPVEKIFTITVTTSNVAPTDISLSNSSVAENQAAGTAVGTFSSTDPNPGNTFTYLLVAGAGSTDNASFTLDASGNLKTAAVFNFEVKSSYSIRVRSTDQGGAAFEEIFTISVTNVNEAPTNIALSNAIVAENLAAGTTVGLFTTTDPDAGNTFTYTLVAGTGSADNASFTIDASGNLKTAAVFNFETKNSYSIRVRSTDQGGLAVDKIFTVTVTNASEAPLDITLTNASVAEGLPSATTVGQFNSVDTDPGSTFTYALVGGTGSTDNISFTVTAGGILRTAAVFNREVKSAYSIRVRSTDNTGKSFEKVFTITVANVNETPTNIALSKNTVPDKQPVNTAVGTFSTTDPDAGNTFTYTLVAGTGSTDNARFTIVGGTLRTNAVFDFNVKSSYSIRVRSTDQGGLSVEKVFTIGVTPSTPLAATMTSITGIRTTAVGVVTVTFNRAVSGVDKRDFSLTRNGVAVSLTNAVFTAVSPTQYTIDLSSITGTGGDYVLTLVSANSSIQDQVGNPLTTNPSTAWTNQQITQFVVQNGQTQHSYIRYMDVTFASTNGLDALIASNRIRLTKFDLNGQNGAVVSFGSVTRIGNTLRFDFGANGLGGNRTSIQGDGYYQISFDLTSNGSFATKKSFYRLLGDANGDRRVDIADYNLIQSKLNAPYDANYDILGIGQINSSFLPIISNSSGRRMNSTLTYDA